MIKQLIRVSMEQNKPLVIIYLSSKGLTQRSIQVKSVHNGYIKAFCYTKGEWRTFKIENILAAEIDYKRGVHHIYTDQQEGFQESYTTQY